VCATADPPLLHQREIRQGDTARTTKSHDATTAPPLLQQTHLPLHLRGSVLDCLVCTGAPTVLRPGRVGVLDRKPTKGSTRSR
jgi:hypothetical protein